MRDPGSEVELTFRASALRRIRSDEGLMRETSAFESLYGGQFTLSTQLIKPNYLISNLVPYKFLTLLII